MFLFLTAGTSAFGQCRPPKYRQGAIFADDDSVFAMSISLSLSSFTVIKTEPAAEGEKDLVASAAVENLSSWRLEPGPGEETFQITYSYAIDNSLRHIDGLQVRWVLPHEVSTQELRQIDVRA
jgi:hypothetical protein